MQVTNLQLKQYLLGSLDEQTEAEIGVQIISDETFEEQLLIAENELIEDFIDKNLTPNEEKLFHENFLVCDDREKQVAEIYFSKQISKKHLAAEGFKNIQETREESFLQKLKNLKLSLAIPIFAVLLIAAVIGFYFVSDRSSLSPLENDYAKLNSQDFSDSKAFSQFSNVDLISETYRSNGDSKKLKTENLSDKVFFRLAILFDISENEPLNAEVIKDQKTIFRQPNVRVYKNLNGQEFRLLLPKEIFTKGAYRIKIENPKTENPAITYDFVVE